MVNTRTLEQIVPRVARAVKVASTLEELLDAILYELGDLEKHLGGNNGATAPAAPPTRANMPAQPAYSLTIRLHPDGTSQVSVDVHGPLRLPSRLTELLILAASRPLGDEGVVPFRPAMDVAKALGIRKAYVFTLVSRLRRKLEEHGWNPGLLETDRSRPDSRIRFLTRETVIEPP